MNPTISKKIINNNSSESHLLSKDSMTRLSLTTSETYSNHN
jgi:hypothetical protein